MSAKAREKRARRARGTGTAGRAAAGRGRAPAAGASRPLRARARTLVRLLKRLYPEASISLDFRDPFQLYVATVLSAQCTDERVNQVTPALFSRFPDAKAMAAGPREEIQALIRPTGFFRNKAKSLQEASQRIADAYGSQLPGSMEELLTLPGVGRKTANVILGNAFGIPGVTVDTHVGRLSQRLGLTTNRDPVKIEYDLMAVVPRKDWTLLSHLLISHGRQVCRARKPLCDRCALSQQCPIGQKGGPSQIPGSSPRTRGRARPTQRGGAPSPTSGVRRSRG